MPELPEVETTRRGILEKTYQQNIVKVTIRNPNLRWPVDLSLGEQLPGKNILAVERRGKYILLTTDIGTLLIHLGMSGTLRIVPNNTPIIKHDHVDIELANGFTLRLNDPRRFGSVLWHAVADGPIESHKLLSKLGPEPLADTFSGEYLYNKSRGRKVAVKSFIMNSHIVVGAGNIYANESLFLSGIHPEKQASKLTKKQCNLLADNIKTVIAAAIKQGGTTLKDFLSPDGKPGYFKQELNVYDQAGKPCKKCGTPIERKVLNQRAAYYCPKCQIK